MTIILIGYRGCGKTTLGRLLANELWQSFVNLDEQVCKRFNNDSIAKIWAEHGQNKWRWAEVQVLREVCGQPDMVVALGGGALTEPEARRMVKEIPHCTRIYLKCQPSELHRRIEQDPQSSHGRPHLTELGGGLEEIQQVLAEREPVYLEVADKVFDVTYLQPPKALRYIIDKCL